LPSAASWIASASFSPFHVGNQSEIKSTIPEHRDGDVNLRVTKALKVRARSIREFYRAFLAVMFSLMEGDLFLKRRYFFFERLAFPC